MQVVSDDIPLSREPTSDTANLKENILYVHFILFANYFIILLIYPNFPVNSTQF